MRRSRVRGTWLLRVCIILSRHYRRSLGFTCDRSRVRRRSDRFISGAFRVISRGSRAIRGRRVLLDFHKRYFNLGESLRIAFRACAIAKLLLSRWECSLHILSFDKDNGVVSCYPSITFQCIIKSLSNILYLTCQVT